jgi:Lar family restriction alleviation protein
MTTNTTQEELLPCPFCGSDQLKVESTCPEDHFVYCLNCECEGPLHMTPEPAIESWNRRKPRRTPPAEQPTPDQRRIEIMRGQIKALCPELRDIGRDDLADRCIEIAGDMAYVPDFSKPAAEGMTDDLAHRLSCIAEPLQTSDWHTINDAIEFIESHLTSKREQPDPQPDAGDHSEDKLDMVPDHVADNLNMVPSVAEKGTERGVR